MLVLGLKFLSVAYVFAVTASIPYLAVSESAFAARVRRTLRIP
jgi:hypothetical protein